jgi:S1-C subfamily serine protease
MNVLTRELSGVVCSFGVIFALTATIAAPSPTQADEVRAVTIQIRPMLKIMIVIEPGGARVREVYKGPAANMERADNRKIKGIMEPGDIITKVEDKPIKTVDDIRNGIAGGGEVKVTVWDKRTRKEIDWIVPFGDDGPPKDPKDPGPKPPHQ